MASLSTFNVVWAKRSNRKRKIWSDDGFISICGRNVKLHSLEGKLLASSSENQLLKLNNLKAGDIVPIADKEVQILERMSKTVPETCEDNPKVNPKLPVHNFFPKDEKANPPKRHRFSNFSPPLIIDSLSGEMPPLLVLPKFPLLEPNGTQNEIIVDRRLTRHLRPHQRDGVIFLLKCLFGFHGAECRGAILADEMGLGKTLQCITAIWTLLKQKLFEHNSTVKKVLIVTPGTLVKNWFSEFVKWLGRERLNVFCFQSENKLTDFTEKYSVLITSYEMFLRHYDEFCKLKFDLLICDEGHRLKNPEIKTYSLLNSLSITRRVILTGTPVQNNLKEFYHIISFVSKGLLGSYNYFFNEYEDVIVRSHQPDVTEKEREMGKIKISELFSRISPHFLQRSAEVLHSLPPRTDFIIFCKPSDVQCLLYRKALDQVFSQSLLNNNCSQSYLVYLNLLKKISNHPALIYRKTSADPEEDSFLHVSEPDDSTNAIIANYAESETFKVSDSGKFEAVALLIDSLKKRNDCRNKVEKIVIVSSFTATLDLIQCLCCLQNYEFLRLDGSTSTSVRNDIVNEFNSSYSSKFILLLSCKAGGTGLNLTGASRLILYDCDWNPANDLQAMGRIWRDGQSNPVFFYRLLTTGTIDEKIFQRQLSKLSVSSAVLASNMTTKESYTTFTAEELKDLFSLNADTSCHIHSQMGCECYESQSDSLDKTYRTDSSNKSENIKSNAERNGESENKAAATLFQDIKENWKHCNESQFSEKLVQTVVSTKAILLHYELDPLIGSLYRIASFIMWKNSG